MGEDADSDGPEELTLDQGRQEAYQQRREESESRKRVAAASKHRKKKMLSKQENKDGIGTTESPSLKGTFSSQENGEQAQVLDGLLDDSIVQFLSSREKSEFEVKPKGSDESRKKKLKKSSGPVNLNHRVQLMMLNDLDFPQYKDALEFRNERLFGSRIRRSVSMLKRSSRVQAS